MTSQSKYAVFLDMVGCRLNQAEIESLAAQFFAAGCVIVASPEAADLVVINSCSVTREADRDSRQKVRQAHTRNPHAEIALTGCWSTLDPENAARLPGVRWVISNDEKPLLPERILDRKEEQGIPLPSARPSVGGIRHRTRAFLPAQLGCDHACAYCVTRLARGAARSIPVDQVVREILAAEDAGAMEAILTGVQLGAWGKDLNEKGGLRTLLDAVLSRTRIPRVRISSLEPWNLQPSLFDAWANPRLCPHLHLPLQSGSAAVLRRMVRPITPEQYARQAEEARGIIPDLAITSDVIVGFPGETELEFAENLDFIREMRFARLHVFRFSPRPGTPAASLAGRIPREELRVRAHQAEQVGKEATGAFLRTHLGCEAEVLWEAGDGCGNFRGWTRNAIRVRIKSDRMLQNRLSRVKLLEVFEGEMRGEVCS